MDNHIVYLARTENYSGDNALDIDDPIYFYISNKKGENLLQITPKGLNVISWAISKNKIILVKLQQDKNRNKKFGDGDDEVYYRIDLHDDISKIKCYQTNL